MREGYDLPVCLDCGLVACSHIEARVNEMKHRISALESALREIAEHPHCDPRDCGDHTEKVSDYGHAYGHRCCAEIARKALEQK